MMRKKYLASVAAAALACTGLFGSEAKAVVDTDITFVIDSSGSMSGEFSFLGGAIGGFLSDLEADSRIGTARAALVEYTSGANLVQDLTSNATLLENAFNSVSTGGGTENAYGAVDAAITDLGISYDANTVKSIILITDEDTDDSASGLFYQIFGYSNSFNTGSSSGDLLALLNDEGFLNNIIYDVGDSSADADFQPVAVPSGAFFDIEDFRNDRAGFFQQFTNTKIQEITQTASVPEPATIGLLGMGLLTLVLIRGRRNA